MKKKNEKLLRTMAILIFGIFIIWLFGPFIGVILLILVGGMYSIMYVFFGGMQEESDEPPI